MNEHIDKQAEAPLSQAGTPDKGQVARLVEQTGEKALDLRVKGKEKMGAMFQHRPEWFLEFLRNTTQKKVLVEHVCNAIPNRHPRVAEKLARGDSTVAILGGGTSEAELTILKRLAPTIKHLHYEDPSAEMEGKFRESLLAQQLQCAQLSVSQQKLEDPQYSLPQDTDVEFASHMFYYVPGWRDPQNKDNPLRKMRDSLSPEGVGVIMAQSKLSDNYAFRSRFLPMIHGPDVNELQAEDISTAMTQMDIAHDNEIVECRTGANDFFNRKGEFEPNAQGAHLLSFLLRYDWNSLEPPLQRQVKDYCMETIHDEDGKRFMVFRDLFVWFKK